MNSVCLLPNCREVRGEMGEKTEEIYPSSVGFNLNVHNNKKIDWCNWITVHFSAVLWVCPDTLIHRTSLQMWRPLLPHSRGSSCILHSPYMLERLRGWHHSQLYFLLISFYFPSLFLTFCCYFPFLMLLSSLILCLLCIVFSSSHSWRLPDPTPCPLCPLLQGPYLLRLLWRDAVGPCPTGAQMWRLEQQTSCWIKTHPKPLS